MTSIHDYNDILNLPRPEPKRHLRMSLSDRAAQFSPFAALTGYSGVIDEAGRVTEEKIYLDDREKDRINRRLTKLQTQISSRPKVKITVYAPDAKKKGGSYPIYQGRLEKIDTYERLLILTNGSKVKFDDIIRIETGNFPE
ncbi:MAG: hypothetical protein II969_02565 [Anaerolineaceae bacterium]|nr:hypothetical protein [Anaerolineaceae bacterium]